MKLLTSHVARWLFVLPFIGFGAMHMMSAPQMAEAMRPPGGEISVYISGIGLILGGLAIGLNKMARLAGLLLGLEMLLIVVLIYGKNMGMASEEILAMYTIDGTHELADQLVMQYQTQNMVHMMKDTALAGAAFAFAGFAK
jgi:uncharacterized membrane protein